MTGRRAVIVGAGVGGLAAAVALARTGWTVEVLEQAPALTEVGAGVQLGPNAVKALDALGLGAAARRAGDAPDAIEIRMAQSGRRVMRQALGPAAAARWGAPYLTVHRADLIALLAEAATAAPAITLRLGAAVTGHEPGGARLAGGALVAGDLIIGADGLRSAARAAVIGAESPRYLGLAAFRATIPAARLGGAAPPGVRVWAGDGAHVVLYPLRGGALLNVVAIAPAAEGAAESWAGAAAPGAARAIFGGWSPLIDAALEAEFLLWPLYDRPPTPAWSKGRLALLGDAAHPAPPSMAQGAGQALEDAVTLAACLNAAPVDAGLAAYFAQRAARAERVRRAAHFNLRVFHRRGALARAATFGPLQLASALAPWALHRRLDWLYGWRPPS